jgi:hypothetical protein
MSGFLMISVLFILILLDRHLVDEDTEWEDFHALFPYLLHTAISQAEEHGLTPIVSWMPCGTSFKVHDQNAFTTAVMPRIGRFTRYKSFLRQLGMYKFERVKSGPSKGAYHHPYFRRKHGDLCRAVLRGEIYYSVASKAIQKIKYPTNPGKNAKEVHLVTADTTTFSTTSTIAPERGCRRTATALVDSLSNWPRRRGIGFEDTVAHTKIMSDCHSSCCVVAPHDVLQSTRSVHNSWIMLEAKKEGASSALGTRAMKSHQPHVRGDNKEAYFPPIDIMDEIISTFAGDAYNP